MSIILEDIDLSGLHVVPAGMNSPATPRTVAETALDGSEVVWEGPAGPTRMTLAGGATHGWLTRETLDRLTALAAVPGARYGLTVGGRTMRVRFCNEEPPAVTASPVEPGMECGPHAPYRDVRVSLVNVS
ncbi:MAG: hypothetical protein ACOCWR_03930 [Oceanidesulfovibrio sp.]